MDEFIKHSSHPRDSFIIWRCSFSAKKYSLLFRLWHRFKVIAGIRRGIHAWTKFNIGTTSNMYYMDEEQPTHAIRRIFGPPPPCCVTTTFSVGVKFPSSFCLFYFHSAIVNSKANNKLFWNRLVELELKLLYNMSWWSEVTFRHLLYVLKQDFLNWLSDRMLNFSLDVMTINS